MDGDQKVNQMPSHKYYVKHREQYRKYKKEHPEKYTEKKKSYMHEYYIKNRDRVHKYYLKNREHKLQYNREHPEMMHQALRKYYKTPKFRAKSIIRSKRVRDDRKKWLSEMKKELHCSVCGQSFPDFPIILDFHHEGKESKETAIGYMMRDRRAKGTILAEIAKCIPVCANCHRRLHNAERQSETKKNTAQSRYHELHFGWVFDMKKNLSCSVCAQYFPDCPSIMDFHHEGGKSKETTITSMIRERRSKEAILAEISKCVPVCANCHRKLHESERQKKEGVRPSPRKRP